MKRCKMKERDGEMRRRWEEGLEWREREGYKENKGEGWRKKRENGEERLAVEGMIVRRFKMGIEKKKIFIFFKKIIN